MKIAVPYDRGRIDQHFGHCQYFEIYTVDDGRVTGKMVLPVSGGGHKYMTGLMKKMNVQVVLTGGMGKPAIEALRSLGIESYMGLSGSTENAVYAYLEGNLKDFNTNLIDLDAMEGHCGCH